MRSGKSLIVLLVVLLGLGAYIYFVESRKPAGDAAETKPKVFAVAADKIADLSLHPAGGDKTVLRKNGPAWEIVEPVSARADEAEVSGITTNLATLENVRVVDENPADLQQYGLAQPRVDVGFKAAGDKDSRHLLVGDKTATGGELYAKLANEKRVFLIAGFLESTFNRSTFDLRDKTILKFDRDKVDRLQLEWPGQATRLALANSEWRLVAPMQAPADYGTVEGAVGRLQSAQMKSIAAQEAGDLKQYGLDEPELTAVIGTGSAQASLLFGKQAEEGTVYAKDASRPMVFTVESSLVDDLKKPADQFRKKDLFAARAYDTTRVEIVRGAETLLFEKVKGQGKDATDKWRETKRGALGSPATVAKDVDAAALETFLTKLFNLRAQSWQDATANTGLDAPALAVTVKFDDGKREEHVVFGRKGPDLFATAAGQPGVARTDATEFDDAVKALEAVK
jgi:hypothetical protein